MAPKGTSLADRVDPMSSPEKPDTDINPPVVDEWGLYDPSRAGLAALHAKLRARRQSGRATNDFASKTAAARQAQKFVPQK